MIRNESKPIYGIISGTNREGSYSLKVAKYIEQFIKQHDSNVEVLDLSQLPLEIYLPTSYKEKPASFAYWQNVIDEAKGLIICIPEYNGSIPGVLKHFFDMLDYPESLLGKPIALIGVSAGRSGAVKPINTVITMLEYHQAKIFEVVTNIPKCWEAISEDGTIVDEEIIQALNNQILEFIQFCKKNG